MLQGIALSSSLFDSENENHIINRKNLRGQTPLYVAAQNGNINILSYLIKRGANPYILSDVDYHNKESIIDVSCRWSHYSALQFLLVNVKWKVSFLAQAAKLCGSKEMKNMLKKVKPLT